MVSKKLNVKSQKMVKPILVIALAVLAAVAAILYMTQMQIFPTTSEDFMLKKFSSYEELKNFLKASSEEFSSYGIYATKAAEGAVATPTAGTSDATRSEDYSTTNIQVAGVDEADIVKNDGKYIYTISGNKIIIIDAFPAEQSKILSTIEINGNPLEIFVNNDKLIIFGNEIFYYPFAGGIEPAVDEKIAIVPPIFFKPKTFVYVYDISDRENPSLARNITLEGDYVDSRMVGDYVYIIANSFISDIANPELPVVTSNGESKTVPASEIFYFPIPDYSHQYTTIAAINTQNDQEEVSSETILMGASQNIFVSLQNIYITYQKIIPPFEYEERIIDQLILPNVPNQIAARINEIKSSNLEKFEKIQRINQIYLDHLNSLGEDERKSLEGSLEEKARELEREIQRESQKTIIHKISFDGNKIEYRNNGEVSGYVLNQFSMDEHGGYFRIATTTSSFGVFGFIFPAVVRTAVAEGSAGGTLEVEIKSVSSEEQSSSTVVARQPVPILPSEPSMFNSLYILDSELRTVGKLENIAPDERIFSARFIGDRAYLVTFRQVDPLFVIDLSDPRNPQILGQLKIPGFSNYLHPYDENHIIGIGKEVSEEAQFPQFPQIGGVKLGLFDVTDPSNPVEISKYEIGDSGTDSEALFDHKAFLFSRDKNLLVIPILLSERTVLQPFGQFTWQGAYVFGVSTENGFALKGRITHVPNDKIPEYYFFSPYSVKRSLFIDGALYTISNKVVKMNSLQNLEEINALELPFVEERPYPIPI